LFFFTPLNERYENIPYHYYQTRISFCSSLYTLLQKRRWN